jgi:hypothetical protein
LYLSQAIEPGKRKEIKKKKMVPNKAWEAISTDEVINE